ncbi:MAG TPA: MMPL family transporter [Steroidobacteraceae bacterium]|jgi:predicted RND superfamily exporter protein|nr:MMPL family transporter [Steroidobacteraceae bacterium]
MAAGGPVRDAALPGFGGWLERCIFGHRALILALFTLGTLALGGVALRGLRIDTSFSKTLPVRHEYMRTYLDPRVTEFQGANRVLVALIARDGNMFTPQFFAALRKATDEVIVMDGIDRTRVQSIFTPNVRYLEVVEDGIEAGNVVPEDFTATPANFARVRDNVRKAGIVGRLVANDFSGALVSAIVLDRDAQGRPVSPIAVAHELERNVRAAIEQPDSGIDVHIIGFAKVVGDIADGAASVVLFAGITLVLTLLAVRLYCQSWRIACVPVMCSLVAVICQLGSLVVLRYGIDPIGLLVPFLIFAIGVSHGVQKISAAADAALAGLDSMQAARRVFRQLLIPAVIALLADLVGFVSILMIPVQVIREMAITASIGVAIVILTDLVLLPVLVSYVRLGPAFRARVERRQGQLAALWHHMAGITARGPALVIILSAALLAVAGWWKGRETPIGDTQAGVPELRADSRYNRDNDVITTKFSIGVDVLTAIVESQEPVCVSHDLMTAIDRFGWHMRNVEGMQEVITLPFIAKLAIAGWNEGSLKWRSIPREQTQLTQSTRYIETSTGLLNENCDVVPVMMFLTDHRAGTIARAVAQVKAWRAANPLSGAVVRLAAGNVGVMAATNETVKSRELLILAGVFGAVIIMCLLTFRSVLGTVLVVVPLALVSVLVYAVMALVGIGLKISTLPMVALGAGIGVDYGIYLFSRMQEFLRQGQSVHDAYEHTLRVTGASIIFTGITLAIGVATWVFSPLKFQADIGVMLTFMFLVNMLAAIILLPALAAWLIRVPPAAPAGAAGG